jgi:hypothetical protein
VQLRLCNYRIEIFIAIVMFTRITQFVLPLVLLPLPLGLRP